MRSRNSATSSDGDTGGRSTTAPAPTASTAAARTSPVTPTWLVPAGVCPVCVSSKRRPVSASSSARSARSRSRAVAVWSGVNVRSVPDTVACDGITLTAVPARRIPAVHAHPVPSSESPSTTPSSRSASRAAAVSGLAPS